MRVRAGARACARGSDGDFDLRKWFLGMRVLSGFAPVWLSGLWSACTDLDFLIFGKTCKILQACIHVLVKLISGFEKNTSFELSRTNILCDETDETKKNLTEQKILTFSGMSDHPSIDCCNLNRPHVVQESWRSPIVNQKTLNRLRISLAPTKFYSLQHQLLELDLARLTFFGIRYVLTYSPNHSSASGCKTLRSSMVYEVLKWHTKTAWMLMCYICPCHVDKSDYLPWDIGLTILAKTPQVALKS